MTKVEFDTEELGLLQEVLERDVNQTDLEISRADRIDFKHMLKHRKESLENILKKIELPAAA